MLKITYTENGFYLEHLNESLETWLANRVLICLRATASIYVEPSTASLLLPINLPYFRDLETLEDRSSNVLELSICDDYSAEVSLQGTWVTTDEDSEEGIFVSSLDERTEFFLYQLWKEGNLDTSLIGE
jgi:hypothetical protein